MKTIDAFDPMRSPYQDADVFGMAPGPPVPNSQTYRGNLTDLVAYLLTKSGTGVITYVGNTSYNMKASDFEIASQVAFSFSPTWTLPPANSIAAGQRRRIVDLAGVIGQFAIVVSPAGGDTIDGVGGAVILTKRYSYLVVETDGAHNWTIVEQGPGLISANNLGDLPSPSAARTNLGLGSAATQNANAFLAAFNNLSELTNSAVARSNLALGALAILNTLAYGNLDPSAIATLAQLLSGTAQKLVTTDVLWNSRTPVVLPVVASATWDFNTFTNGLLGPVNLPSSNMSVTAINAKPGQTGFIVIKSATSPNTFRSVLFQSPPFDFINTTTGIYGAVNTINLLEYWVENSNLIRCRMNQNIT